MNKKQTIKAIALAVLCAIGLPAQAFNLNDLWNSFKENSQAQIVAGFSAATATVASLGYLVYKYRYQKPVVPVVPQPPLSNRAHGSGAYWSSLNSSNQAQGSVAYLSALGLGKKIAAGNDNQNHIDYLGNEVAPGVLTLRQKLALEDKKQVELNPMISAGKANNGSIVPAQAQQTIPKKKITVEEFERRIYCISESERFQIEFLTSDTSVLQEFINEGGNLKVLGNELLQTACFNNILSGARFLLQNGFKVDSFLGVSLADPIRFGHFEMAELFIECGANLNAEADSGGEVDTPLLILTRTDYASYMTKNLCNRSMHERSPIIKLLIRSGADLDACTTSGFNIHDMLYKRAQLALTENNLAELAIIKDLQEHIEEYTKKFNDEATAVCLGHLNCNPNAKAKGELDNAMIAFIQGPKLNEEKRQSGLRNAIRLNILWSWKPSQYPLDLEYADEAGYTPLLYAAYLGRYRAVANLLKFDKVNLDMQNKYGQTAQMIAHLKTKARESRDFLAIEELLEEERGRREEIQLAFIKAEQERLKKEEANSFAQLAQLKQAVSDNNQDTVRDCLNLRTVNKKYLDGSLPLIHAAGLGRIAIVTQMLAQGAQINARDDNYHTALTKAVINGHVDMVALLLPHMALADIKVTVGGRTAYDFAKKSAMRIAKLLSESSLPEYTQQQQKYEQIMMLLDSYNGVIASTGTAAAN